MQKEWIIHCEFCTEREYCKNYKLFDVHVVENEFLKCLDVDMEMYRITKKNNELSGKLSGTQRHPYLNFQIADYSTATGNKMYFDYGENSNNFVRVIFATGGISLQVFQNGTRTNIWTGH